MQHKLAFTPGLLDLKPLNLISARGELRWKKEEQQLTRVIYNDKHILFV